MNTELLFDFFMSMKWLWIVLVIILARFLKAARVYMGQKNDIKAREILKDIKYKEEEIIEHLDYIINEALDSYVLFNIKPKQISYINSKIENEIMNYLAEEVPGRISSTLYSQLAYIYNEDYIGSFIGTHIYMVVLQFRIEYNDLKDPE